MIGHTVVAPHHHRYRPATRLTLWALLVAGAVHAQPRASLPFLADGTTGLTNQVVLRLNYDSPTALARVSPYLSVAKPESETEDDVVRSINEGLSADFNAISTRNTARFLIEQNRLSKVQRAMHEKARKTGALPADAYDPLLRLNQYIVIRTDSITAAKKLANYAKLSGLAQYAEVDQSIVVSATPSDSFFSSSSSPPSQYQWGAIAMNFPLAWDITKGNAYVGVLDLGWPGIATGSNLVPHLDLANSFRSRMVDIPISSTYRFSNGTYTAAPTLTNHTVHVTGIIGAQHNNGHGVAGGCPNCSVVPYPFATSNTQGSTATYIAARMKSAVDGGMQVINWSGGAPSGNCSNFGAPVCDSLEWAKLRQVLVIVSAGNDRNVVTPSGGPQFPGSLGDSFPVLPVGGIDSAGARWDTGLPNSDCCELGTNNPSSAGVMGPASLVVSAFNAGEQYSSVVQSSCSDKQPLDASFGRYSIADDGYGTCTGTSMAAPFVTSVAALIRSVYPRATIDEVRLRLRSAGNNATNNIAFPDPTFGYGLINAHTAVSETVRLLNSRRLTPLYASYSLGRKDSFYTSSPQTARAAAYGTMLPKVMNTSQDDNRYTEPYGNPTSGPQIPPATSYPFEIGPVADMSRAEVWVFTTSLNPINATVPLTPLIRMTWRCGDPFPPPNVCGTNPAHVDTVLVDQNEISSYYAIGYRVDGIEGYVYPRTIVQPPGTVRLLKRYNPTLDDTAVFPEVELNKMTGWGYSNFSGLDWIGYVYPNPAGGAMPTY